MSKLMKFVVACLVAVVLVALSMLALRHPLNEPDQVQRMLAESRQRADALRALPEEENGYLDLEPLLNAPVDKPDPTIAKLEALAAYPASSVQALQLKIDSDPSTFKAALTGFTEALPTIRRALSKPHFAWPPSADLTVPSPSLKPLRAMVLALNVDGLDKLRRKQTHEGLEQLMMAAEFAAKLPADAGLLAVAFKISSLGACLDAVNSVVARQEIEANELRWLLHGLCQLRMPSEDFGRAMDAEMTVMANTLEAIMAGKELSDSDHHGESVGGGGLFSGSSFLVRPYFRRNLNLMLNFHMQNRAAFYDPSVAFDASLGEQLQKRWMAHLVRIMVPNFARARNQYVLAITHLEATKVVVALQLYRAGNGQYPDDLSVLVGDYLPEAPVDLMAGGGSFDYKKGDKSFTLSSESPLYAQLNKNSPYIYFPFSPPVDDKLKK